MATTLDDRAILMGKFIGIVRRCLLAWLLLLGHTVLFSLAGIIHPIAIFQMGLLVAGIVTFLTGAGLYFSSCFKRTTTAVLMNCALAAFVWGVLPLLLGIFLEVTGDLESLVEAYVDTNPFVHVVVIMDAAIGSGRTYGWASGRSSGVAESTIWMLLCAAGYMALGLLFALRSKRRFRRNVF